MIIIFKFIEQDNVNQDFLVFTKILTVLFIILKMIKEHSKMYNKNLNKFKIIKTTNI